MPKTPSRPRLDRIAAIGLTVAALVLLGSTAACAKRATPVGSNDLGGGSASSGGDYGTGPGGSGSGAVAGSAEDFRINVGDRVFFDLDSHQIRSEAYPRLDAQAAWLQRYTGISVRIEGNADERGTAEYNLALAARRAEAVRTYLVNRGVAPARIDTISFGKERPISAGASEAAFSQNRNAYTAIVSQR